MPFNFQVLLRIAFTPLFWATISVIPVAAQQADAPLDDRLLNEQSSFLVRAELNHRSSDYRQGDQLFLKVVSEEDAWVYVLFQQADGKVFQIFPNALQPQNRVTAKQAVQIPALDDQFRWTIGPPYGREVVKVIAAREEVNALSLPHLRQKRFNAVDHPTLKAVEQELDQEEPSRWSEFDLPLHTYAREERVQAANSRRFGVFVGVSEYQFHAEAEQLGGGLNLSVSHKDALDMAETAREVGKLSDLRVLTNRQATRANIQQAITGWLASVSRPGDTVLIYFSGHGTQIPDDNRDELDKYDEALLPYDYVPYRVAKRLMDRIERGDTRGLNVTPAQYHGWQALRERARRHRQPEQMLFQHATTISDDAFARWLQKLDGRQILVIVDACHSGGLIAGQKGFDTDPTQPFEFLKSEIVRMNNLKDIDRADTFVLAACRAGQVTIEVPKFQQSLMTHVLLTALYESSGPMTFQNAYQICRRQMADYLANLPPGRREKARHEPVFYPAGGGATVYLKP